MFVIARRSRGNPGNRIKMLERKFYVYMMFNRRNGTIYTGVTNDIVKRVWEHKNRVNPDSFSVRYNCDKLGYWEDFQYVNDAIEREKHIKAQSRKYKLDLIESINPDWLDLSLQDIFWVR